MASGVVAAAPVLAPCAARQQHGRAPMAARAAPFVGGRPQQQRARQAAAAQRCARLVVAAAAQAEVGKLISKVEIPAFIPRQDLIDQLLRWASIEIQENGVANCGTPCKVTPVRREGQLWGFVVAFLKDGESSADVRVAFDEEITLKHEWVGRGEGLLPNGFPILEGNAEEVVGKHFEIRKVCDRQLSDATRASIRDFCQLLVAAINKYYAFGSCFVDDAT